MISQAALKEWVVYYPTSGNIKWRKDPGKRRLAGKRFGSKMPVGYIAGMIGGNSIYAHRLAFLYMTGKIPRYVDHINMIKFDNRWKNLRPATKRDNNVYRVKNKNAKNSQYKGVRVCGKKTKTWSARIKINDTEIHIGCFNTEVDAARAYNKKAKELFGEFAYINTIPKNGK
jgi:hypothetical protein